MGKPTINVAVLGGGMFFNDIIGQTMKDFVCGGIAGALSSVGMSHWAPKVADIQIQLVAIGTHSEKSHTAHKICEWWNNDMPPDTCPKPYYGENTYNHNQDIELRHHN